MTRRHSFIYIAVAICLLSARAGAESLADYNRLLSDVSAKLNRAIALEKRHKNASNALLEGILRQTSTDIDIRTGRSTIVADLSWLHDDVESPARTRAKAELPQFKRPRAACALSRKWFPAETWLEALLTALRAGSLPGSCRSPNIDRRSRALCSGPRKRSFSGLLTGSTCRMRQRPSLP